MHAGVTQKRERSSRRAKAGKMAERAFLASIELDGVVYVRIYKDGTVEYVDGYEPDQDARRFWEASASEIVRAFEARHESEAEEERGAVEGRREA